VVQPAVVRKPAVQAQHALAARQLVQPIHILRDQREPARRAPRERRQRMVAGVGLHAQQLLAPLGVPVPDALGVAPEGLLRGQVLGPKARPQAGLRIAERGHARLGADAGAGQHRDAARVPQPGAGLVEGG